MMDKDCDDCQDVSKYCRAHKGTVGSVEGVVVDKINGERRQFKTGAVRDSEEGKVDFIETISWTAFNRYAQYMTGKKSKYGDGNFKKGMDIESYERSLMRHIDKYLRNRYEGGADEPDEDHLSAAVFNLFGILHEEGTDDNHL